MKFITLLSVVAFSSQIVFGQVEHKQFNETRVNEIVNHICASNPAQTQECTSDFAACKSLTDPKAKRACIRKSAKKYHAARPKHKSICSGVEDDKKSACREKVSQCKLKPEESAERRECITETFHEFVSGQH